MKASIFILSFILIFFSCKKKTDPVPTSTTTNNNNGMDTTLLKNKKWIHIDTLYANCYQIEKYKFNTNGTYVETNINIYPNNPSDSIINNGKYYLKFGSVGDLNFYFNGSPSSTTYVNFGISKLTTTEFWFSNINSPIKYFVQ